MTFGCAITGEDWEDLLEYYGRDKEEGDEERERREGNGGRALHPSSRPAFIAVGGVHRRGYFLWCPNLSLCAASGSRS